MQVEISASEASRAQDTDARHRPSTGRFRSLGGTGTHGVDGKRYKGSFVEQGQRTNSVYMERPGSGARSPTSKKKKHEQNALKKQGGTGQDVPGSIKDVPDNIKNAHDLAEHLYVPCFFCLHSSKCCFQPCNAFICMGVGVCAHVCVCMCECVYMHTYLCMCACIYVFTYTHLHIHAYMYLLS
jgi:hypothetical protein